MATHNLIPREILFGNPERTMARISPDGKMISFLASREGVLNVFVSPLDNLAVARPVTDDKTTGITDYFWSYNCRYLLFSQDKNGDEDFHLYSVDLSTDKTRDLTPFEQISAQIVHQSHRFPDEILVGINDRDEHWFHDVYRINVITGKRELLIKNDRFVGFMADDDYNVKIALTFTPAAESLVLKSDPSAADGWSTWLEIGAEEVMNTALIGFDKTGEQVYLIDSRQRNTSALRMKDFSSGAETTIFETDLADINRFMVHPTECNIEAAAYTFEREQWDVLDDAVQADFDFLTTVEAGELRVTSRTLDDTKWIVVYTLDNGPVKYYLYDRPEKRATFLFSNRPALEELPLANMHSVVIKARDGLDLISYFTIPVESDPDNTGRPVTPLPLVLLVHGGPWYRDRWGFVPEHQWLANRGYAVLSVNFRGSTGLGKNFINAANHQWAGKMHDDLIDAVQWAVNEGIASENKVAIMGGSYGGYAALVGLTFTPETFACGIDIVGPSNLISLLENPPPYWQPIMPLMQARVGDYKSESGREFLKTRSPLFHVDKIKRPLLIGQGASDPRVKQQESDQIVEAMKAKNIPVTYVLFPEEGHGFKRPENDIAFAAITEAFLARQLGGDFEPIGKAFVGANFDVPAGMDGVPGLAESYATCKSPT